MSYDSVPAGIAGVAVSVAPVLPGPTRDEWAGAAVGLVALVIREIVWWFRNRRA